jgi:hypothetical protein
MSVSRKIYYENSKGIHTCDEAVVHGRIRLIWTHCHQDVPANQAFTTTDCEPEVTCSDCLANQQATNDKE